MIWEVITRLIVVCSFAVLAVLLAMGGLHVYLWFQAYMNVFATIGR